MSENNPQTTKRTYQPRKNPADLSDLVYGKLPPQATDLEEAVLGAFMIDRDAVTNAIEILREDSFYDDRHRLIFKAIRQLFEKTQPIDILTVTEELRKMGRLEKPAAILHHKPDQSGSIGSTRGTSCPHRVSEIHSAGTHPHQHRHRARRL